MDGKDVVVGEESVRSGVTLLRKCNVSVSGPTNVMAMRWQSSTLRVGWRRIEGDKHDSDVVAQAVEKARLLLPQRIEGQRRSTLAHRDTEGTYKQAWRMEEGSGLVVEIERRRCVARCEERLQLSRDSLVPLSLGGGVTHVTSILNDFVFG